MAPSLYFTYSEENRVFSDVSMWQSGAWTVTGLGEPEEVPGLTVTNRFLPVLEVQAALGRRFTASDDDPKSVHTVMVSDGYWRSHLGGDRSVLGRRILVNSDAYEVIGVLPASFQFMDRKMSLILPLRNNRAEVRLINFCCQGIARMKPGATLAQANRDVARMIPMAPEKFHNNPGLGAKAFTNARIQPTLRSLIPKSGGGRPFPPRVLFGESGGSLFQIMADLVGDVLVGGAPVSEHAQAAGKLAPQRHRLSLHLQQPRDRRCPPIPVRRFNLQLLPPGTSQRIELRPPRVVRLPPLRIQPAHAFEALKRRQQRTGIDLEHTARHLLDAPRDPEPMHRFETERLQDEHVESALN
jgi:hypothetical protein